MGRSKGGKYFKPPRRRGPGEEEEEEESGSEGEKKFVPKSRGLGW
jgi:hypothetical protein